MFRRATPGVVATVVLVALLVLAATSSALPLPVAGEAAHRSPDGTLTLLADILERFPDRKTSSSESGQFLSYASALLEVFGWRPTVFQYETTLRSYSAKDRSTTFLHVSGENLLAFGPGPGPSDISLLIVAPYDNLLSDYSNPLEPRPYTAASSAALLRLASELGGEQGPDGGVALALVSGHYQLGAGTRAVMEYLKDRGVDVRGALLLGDMFSSSPLAIAPNEVAPALSALRTQEIARECGLDSRVAFPAQFTWFVTVLSGAPGTISPDALLGIAGFDGEGSILNGCGVPAITLGFPTGDKVDSGSGATPYTFDAGRISAIVESLMRLSGDIDRQLFGSTAEQNGAKAGDSVAFAIFGRTTVATKGQVRRAATASAVLAISLLVVFRRLLSGSDPALLGGISLAAALSFVLTWGLVSDRQIKYMAWVNPVTPAAAILVIFTTLISVGFLQMWNVKTRIANLPKKNAPDPSGAPMQSNPRTTASGWGLAVMAATTAGTGLTASPYFPYALAATAGLAAAVIAEGAATARKSRLGPFIWALRGLYLLPVWAAVFWAGRPDRPQYLTHLAATLMRPGIETFAMLLSLITTTTCFISTLRLPGALSRKRRFLLPVTQLLLVVIAGWVLTAMPWMSASARPLALVNEQMSGAVRVYVAAPTNLEGISYTMPDRLEPMQVSKYMVDKAGNLSISTAGAAGEDAWAYTEVTVDAPRTPGEDPKGDVTSGAAAEVRLRADLKQRPTYLALSVADVVPARSAYPREPIELTCLEGLLGKSPEPDEVPKPSSGYRVNYIWWHPKETIIEANFGIIAEGSSRGEVALAAVYLDKSISGIRFWSPTLDFLHLTQISSGGLVVE